MSNESPVSAATSAANPITAEAVAAWLVAQAAALNLPDSCVYVYTSTVRPGTVRWIVECAHASSDGCRTLDAAIATLRAKIKSPADVAAEKRREAQRLIAEAAALEAAGQPHTA